MLHVTICEGGGEGSRRKRGRGGGGRGGADVLMCGWREEREGVSIFLCIDLEKYKWVREIHTILNYLLHLPLVQLTSF